MVIVMDGMMGMGWLFAGLWGLVGLAVLVLLVVGIIWLVRSLVGQGQSMLGPSRSVRERPDAAEAELRRRYASGEIDREEFQRRLGDLREL